MPFVGRSRETIRSELLASWAANYAALGLTLQTSLGSDAYLMASAFAVQMEGIEAQAEQTALDILPDTAGAEALDRHAYVDGIARRAGFTARHTVTVTGAAATTYTIPAGTRMSASDGTPYVVESASVVTSGGPATGTITVRAVEAGATGTADVGDVLTFATAPTGLNSTGTVASTLRDGTDAESDESLADRIIARRRERPGSGNRADWASWVEAYTGTEIAQTFVYPLLAPPASYPGAGTPSTPGCVTVVAVGPAQGDSATNTRIVPLDDDLGTRTPGAELVLIEDYIEGDRLPDGTDVSSTPNDPLRPVTVTPGNYGVEAISTVPQTVVMSVVVSYANILQWSGTMTVVSATSSTLVVSGDQTANSGFRALVSIGSTYRGSYKLFTLGTGTFGGVNTTFPMTDPTIATAVALTTVYPGHGNFNAMRTAALNYFDSLGPGDTTPASRWPAEDDTARARLYITALAAAVNGAEGVLSATTTTPASDVSPAAKTVVELTFFRTTT